MGKDLAILFLVLPLVAKSLYSPSQTTDQAKKRCDEKLLVTMKTECQSCFLNFEMDCPAGYMKITNGSGIRDCRYYLAIEIKTYTLSLPGCRHICTKEFQQPECCQGYWGPNCMACPGGATSPCNNRGRCSQGINGDGTCACQGGFGGTACETCVGDDLFGPNCTSVCSCIHGACNSGITGDGRCTCFSGYKGINCDERLPSCDALQCPENSRCSTSPDDETNLECACLPNYQGDGKTCEPINPCSKAVCDPNAYCIYLGPNRHKCTCQEGYRGDGQVCLPIDPCQGRYGNCPAQSTICKYDGPGKSHCECKEHYRNFVPGKGCRMTDICVTNNTCHKNAKCTMVAPGQITCTCQKGYVGNGFICYGNIMERIRDLNTELEGQWQGKLTSALSLMEYAYEWALSSLGPLTVLLPTNKGFRGVNINDLLSNKEKAQYFAKLHIIAGQLGTNDLNNTNTIYTLTGKSGEILKGDKDNQLKIRLQGGKKKGKILQGDLIASNGILHIIDKAMDNVEPTFENTKEKTTLAFALEQDGGPYTVFVPSNNALDNMQDGALDYLLSAEGSRKLLELIRYHIISYTQLEVASLISIERVRSMANQFIYFNTSSNGQILVNGEEMEETDIVAKNGRIYTLAGVLTPPSIVPILPHRCDEERSEIKMGPCVKCSMVYRSTCPGNSKPISLSKGRCVYETLSNLATGCARYCNVTVKEPKCCKGFYGSDCSQCPGGFSKPCSGNGQCVDGMKGNGTCICAVGFQGSHCQFCSNPDKYGPQCDKKCPCMYGKCNNRIDSEGGCLPGSCRSGYIGKFCDKHVIPCQPFVQFCHAQATCQLSDGIRRCVCNPGYEGDGTTCSEVDPCATLIPGGCDINAECIKTGLGTHTCICQPGWSGDGRDCSAINNCLLPNRGGCHDNATCMYVGPGQNDCECKEGFRGNGIECEPINSCLDQNGKCHHLATCQFVSSGVWSCVCPKGYEGDGTMCYGNAADELSALSEAAGFNQWIDEAAINSVLSTTPNLTVLVPSLQAFENMDQDEKAFWMSKNNIVALLKYHILVGAYTLADFQNLSSSDTLPTSLHGNFLHLSKENENITVEGAKIVVGDIAATNGVIHVIDKVLMPLIGVSGMMPKLLARLEQMPDYSIFRGYVIQYSLANDIEAANSYTVFAPNNDAIESYLRNKRTVTLDEDQIRYHIVLEEKLLKSDMHNGMHRETMLGFSYQVGFFLQNDQLYINDAPINYTNIATDKGIIHGLGKVLEIQKNRCDINDTVIKNEKCSTCLFRLLCPPGTKAVGEKKYCIYTEYYRGRISSHIGCQTTCMKTVITRGCCAGFFGPQCQPCPGKAGNACFGNGVCMDGVNGTGECKCDEGFNGTACETCNEGKYGRNCDQECPCVHGKCNSGTEGDGTCECDVGWRGVRCNSEIKDDACNRTCHTSANCFLQSNSSAYCKCAAGFKGNGTYCTAIDACEIGNGGCSVKAECRRTTPGNRVCVCKMGYTGDGIVCLEINPCLKNHGGCDRNAECTQTGPNQAVCNCLKGYSGDGKTCTYISLCSVNNGGCSEFAICNDTELTERTCTCKPDYIGDGFKCQGNIYQELLRNSNTSMFYYHMKGLAINDLTGSGPFTVFAPNKEAFVNEPQTKYWITSGVMPQILRYHMVACARLLYNDLTTTANVTSLQGDPIQVNYSQNSLYLNNKAKIVSSDAVGTNGVIHVIDKMLVPQHIQQFPAGESGTKRESLKMVAAKHGYILFSNLLEDAGLMSLINDPIHKPVTLFWPTDAAIRALPQEQQDFLFKKSNKDKLVQYLKFHIIRDAKISACDLPGSNSLKTLQGSDLSVKCGDNNDIGALFLNDRRCKIMQRHLEFDGGIAYGIDCMLTDPTLGGRCDSFITGNFTGDCAACYSKIKCPTGAKPQGGIQKCTYKAYGRSIEGCRQDCSLVIWIAKCCKGYFGRDCQACPGGPEAPCNNHGSCKDGYTGTGECTCNPGFNGTSCELCSPGRYGFSCKPCECTAYGQCDEGYSGSGRCFCETGWTGQFCDTKLVLPPTCSPSCSSNAVCQENNLCQCKPFYEGDGITCTAVNLCKQNNGGCHKNGKCTQIGVKVFCSCQKGYKGDGYMCLPINPCADGYNGGCHEHAICTMTGPDKRKCECKNNYVGDGLDCTVMQLPVDRCLQDNGQCHANAICGDLHFQDATVGVFHFQSPQGQYKLTYEKAKEACANESATIATYNQLSYAQKARYHLCSAGWLDTGRVGYPTAFSSPNCGSGVVGIIDYGPRVNLSETWDVFCYRVKEVNCTCKPGYVGDGFMCSGNLLQVLMSFSTFTNFVSEVLAYSNSSRKGKEFLKYLSDLSIQATLFAPNNDGLRENETLSGRDIEYHLSNASTVFYEDLANGTTLQTRIGKKLLITRSLSQDFQLPTIKQETSFVDGRAITEWDIIASNGIIHVISAPLKAPPVPHSLHAASGTGIFFATILLIGILVFIGYTYFRFKNRTSGFQHFKSIDDIDATALDNSQPSNITNPSYESSTATAPPERTYDPFSDSDEQQLVTSGPQDQF
ncbi:PREDICTED: stabilin-2 isoform X2 [Gavialis gangeticus]|uniref:stabilin-2 isoform X2 n=1 Tax=Gavialis gangeticus TaxID=94835 RepID=UPI00092E28CD|nr:PREDICTED: stabilin-2 isoform X2 [Gavialis gangeticus]